ncbi:MAG: hypothetical protein JSS12_01495 [Verrucomicrobia bacterium]|nr:hypothetical protein [Verrucomicrobiota bacterium]
MKKLVRGFLPEVDPLIELPPVFTAWEAAAKNLPKLLVGSQFQKTLEELPPFPFDALKTKAEIERAMQLLSYFGHAYVWGQKTAPKSIPEVLAKPWWEVAKMAGRPPVLSYASYALTNWKRLDPKGPIDLGNIVLIQNFLGGIDEEWFILVHVAIEAKAHDALNACIDAIDAKDAATLNRHLSTMATSLEAMCDTLDRMPERCDPYIYFTRVRPYIHGWKNHPAFPVGLIYSGVDDKPKQYRGETGAQSSIIPTLDGLLGITHTQDELYHYLQEMREYMPEEHRAFLAYVEQNSHVRAFVKEHSECKELYNRCVSLINRFRLTHLGYAAAYIQKQHQATSKNPTEVGTGGTPFMSYLKKHQDETSAFILE